VFENPERGLVNDAADCMPITEEELKTITG